METAGRRLRLVAATLVPALAVLAVQMILFPLPLGVMLQGVIVGLLGALVAVGMALVYRANRILNFAQVQLGLAPTVLAVSLIVYAGVNYFLAVTVGLVGSLLVGSLVELVIIRRFFNSPRLILTVATIGLSQLLGAAALFIPLIWGQQNTSNVVHVPISLTFTVFPLVFTADDVVALIVAPLALLGVALMLRFSNIGIAVRASAERADRASLLGIPVKRLQTVVWAVAAVLSFIGVFLQAGILGLPLGLDLSFTVLLASLAALVLGNLVDLPAVALAAVALGILQQGVLWNNESDPGLVGPVLAAVVIAVLLVRRVGSSRVGFNAVSTWVVSEEVRPVPPELRSLIEIRAVRWVGGLVIGGRGARSAVAAFGERRKPAQGHGRRDLRHHHHLGGHAHRMGRPVDPGSDVVRGLRRRHGRLRHSDLAPQSGPGRPHRRADRGRGGHDREPSHLAPARLLPGRDHAGLRHRDHELPPQSPVLLVGAGQPGGPPGPLRCHRSQLPAELLLLLSGLSCSWWRSACAVCAAPGPAGSFWPCGRTNGRRSPSGSTWLGPSSPPSHCRDSSPGWAGASTSTFSRPSPRPSSDRTRASWCSPPPWSVASDPSSAPAWGPSTSKAASGSCLERTGRLWRRLSASCLSS